MNPEDLREVSANSILDTPLAESRAWTHVTWDETHITKMILPFDPVTPIYRNGHPLIGAANSGPGFTDGDAVILAEVWPDGNITSLWADDDLTGHWIAVPEPSAIGLLLLGAAMAARHHRRPASLTCQ